MSQREARAATKLSPAALRLLELMKGASTEDWLFLANLANEQQTRFYIHESKSVVDHAPPGTPGGPAAGSTTPWPVQWLCCRYNRKHILPTKKPISADTFVAHCTEWEKKLRWKYALRRQPQAAPLIKRKLKHLAVPHPPQDSNDPALEAFIYGIRSTLSKHWKNAMAKHAKFGTGPLKLASWAMNIVKQNNWHLIANDKEPGWTVHTTEDLCKVLDDILVPSVYIPEGKEFVAMDLLTKDIHTFSKLAARQENDKRWASLILRSWYRKAAPLQAKVAVTIKTTKPAGQVSHRNLHCAPAARTEGLSEWINKSLNEHFKKYSHIVDSTSTFIDELQKIKPEPGDVMVRIDLDSFFMSGNAS